MNQRRVVFSILCKFLEAVGIITLIAFQAPDFNVRAIDQEISAILAGPGAQGMQFMGNAATGKPIINGLFKVGLGNVPILTGTPMGIAGAPAFYAGSFQPARHKYGGYAVITGYLGGRYSRQIFGDNLPNWHLLVVGMILAAWHVLSLSFTGLWRMERASHLGPAFHACLFQYLAHCGYRAIVLSRKLRGISARPICNNNLGANGIRGPVVRRMRSPLTRTAAILSCISAVLMDKKLLAAILASLGNLLFRLGDTGRGAPFGTARLGAISLLANLALGKTVWLMAIFTNSCRRGAAHVSSPIDWQYNTESV